MGYAHRKPWWQVESRCSSRTTLNPLGQTFNVTDQNPPVLGGPGDGRVNPFPGYEARFLHHNDDCLRSTVLRSVTRNAIGLVLNVLASANRGRPRGSRSPSH